MASVALDTSCSNERRDLTCLTDGPDVGVAPLIKNISKRVDIK